MEGGAQQGRAAPRAALRLTIHGRVHGVFYRDWTVGNARDLALGGWVRNEPDGSVAAHIEGEPEAVEEMVARMGAGPHHARVERIDRDNVEAQDFDTFKRR